MKGFTLLETIIAMAVLAIGIVASLTLVSKSVQTVKMSQNRLIASYLAQEGIELVRNIRDSNGWGGLSDCIDCEIDYFGVLENKGNPSPFLKLDTTSPTPNFYSYTSGDLTQFQREVTVVSLLVDKKQVTSIVFWTERGIVKSVQIEGFLYNWK